MSEDLIEAEYVEVKLVGSNVVMFNLSDGTRIKATISLPNVLQAKETNPDGSHKYGANIGVNLEFLQPVGKVVKVPRTAFGPPQPSAKPKDTRQIT